jgi:hypothetical protein
MGCEKCIYHRTESDGDYCQHTWSYCERDERLSNLKSFPFNKIPKSCKKKARVNPEMLPAMSRFYDISINLCSNVCSRSSDESIKYDTKKGCSPWTCDAFMYLMGRTDIHEQNTEFGMPPTMTEEKIREVLKGKKFKIRNSRFKTDFKVAVKETCAKCQGDYIKYDGKYVSVCDNCQHGRVLVSAELP